MRVPTCPAPTTKMRMDAEANGLTSRHGVAGTHGRCGRVNAGSTPASLPSPEVTISSLLSAACSAFSLCATAEAQAPALRLQPVASGLSSPVHVTAPRSETNRLYVVEKTGRIRVLVNGRLRAAPFLDIRSLVSPGLEQGLLSVAFHPV